MIYVALGLLAGLSMFGGAAYSRRQRTITECKTLGHDWKEYPDYYVCQRCGFRTGSVRVAAGIGIGIAIFAACLGTLLALIFAAWATDRVVDALFAIFRS